MPQSAPPRGKHLVADLAARTGLDDPGFIEAILREAAELARVTLLDIRLHHFGPASGVTGVALLAESHISIHTWPESGAIAVDIFTCGDTARPEAALDHLTRCFDAELLTLTVIDRLPTHREGGHDQGSGR